MMIMNLKTEKEKKVKNVKAVMKKKPRLVRKRNARKMILKMKNRKEKEEEIQMITYQANEVVKRGKRMIKNLNPQVHLRHHQPLQIVQMNLICRLLKKFAKLSI